jgi:predicted dithiol-disulfide oxidoreductase (DUF899 family)
VNILEKWLEYVNATTDGAIKITDLFEAEALKIIYNYSFGIPLLILESCSKALWHLRNIIVHDIGNNTNLKVSSKLAMEACKATKCLHASQYTNLSDIKKEVIKKSNI